MLGLGHIVNPLINSLAFASDLVSSQHSSQKAEIPFLISKQLCIFKILTIGFVGVDTISRMKKRQIVVRKEGSRRSSSASTVRSVRYAECQKNHAASLGGYAVDGCREFMASGEEGTGGELVCAACGCHRNFHRKEVESEVASASSSPPYNDA